MNVNTIQLDKYVQNTANKAVNKSYSILVNGEKFVVGNNPQHAQTQNSALKETTFAGNSANIAAKKGYTVLINGEKYIVGASKNVIKKSNNATHAIFAMFKKILPTKNSHNKSINVIA